LAGVTTAARAAHAGNASEGHDDGKGRLTRCTVRGYIRMSVLLNQLVSSPSFLLEVAPLLGLLQNVLNETGFEPFDLLLTHFSRGGGVIQVCFNQLLAVNHRMRHRLQDENSKFYDIRISENKTFTTLLDFRDPEDFNNTFCLGHHMHAAASAATANDITSETCTLQDNF
jgi:hypothetical protein